MAKKEKLLSNPALAKLSILLANKRNTLRWHHDAGRLVAKCAPGGKGRYKQKQVENLVKALSTTIEVSDRFLILLRKFAITYPSPRDLAALKGLDWSHITCLLSIKLVKRRDRFQTDCLNHGWSYRKLRHEVMQTEGRRKQRNVKLKSPKSSRSDVAFPQMLQLTEKWLKAAKVWLNPVSIRKHKRPTDDELLSLIDDMIESLGKLSVDVSGKQKALVDLQNELRKASKKRGQPLK